METLGQAPKQEEKPKNKTLSFLLNNKGLLLAIIVVIIVAIIGISSLFDFGSTSQYQGLIQKVEQETSLK